MNIKIKSFVSIILALILVFQNTGIGTALATRTFTNFAGVTTAKAMKDVWIVNATAWNGHIRSWTTNPVYNIGTIGWVWWTFRETCSGLIVDNWPKPGYVEYGANYVFDTGADDRDACGGTREGCVLGKHDFKHASSTWQPEFTTIERI